MSDLCVCCGTAVPEGRQVCPNCEKPKTDKPFTNGDRLRAMNDGELSVFLNGTFVCECCVYGGTCTEPYNSVSYRSLWYPLISTGPLCRFTTSSSSR